LEPASLGELLDECANGTLFLTFVVAREFLEALDSVENDSFAQIV
tara:strand:- start:66 stop:200 length:135 start_codon:yes stop_codon:yes gene_type:complete